MVQGGKRGEEGYIKQAGDSVELPRPLFEDRFCGRARKNTVGFVTQNLVRLAEGAPSAGVFYAGAPLPIMKVGGDEVDPALCPDTQEFELVGVGFFREVGGGSKEVLPRGIEE